MNTTIDTPATAAEHNRKRLASGYATVREREMARRLAQRRLIGCRLTPAQETFVAQVEKIELREGLAIELRNGTP